MAKSIHSINFISQITFNLAIRPTLTPLKIPVIQYVNVL